MPSTCSRKSYGGARNVTAYANRVMRKKYPNYYAKKNTNQAFMNMGAAANAMISKNKQQANAAANAALNASKAAVTVEAAVNNAKKNNGNFWNSLNFGSTKKNNAAKAVVASTNAALNKAKNMAKLANNAAKVAANAAKVANSLRSAAAAGGSRRNRSRRNRTRRN